MDFLFKKKFFSFLKKIKLVEDLLHPLESTERSKHKLKRLVQGPNSFFMDVKCPGNYFLLFLKKKVHNQI